MSETEMETSSSGSQDTDTTLKTCSVKKFIFRSLKTKPPNDTSKDNEDGDDFDTLTVIIPEVRDYLEFSGTYWDFIKKIHFYFIVL